MNVVLERFVEDDWYKYGTYNIAVESEAKALVDAIRMLGADVRVRLA